MTSHERVREPPAGALMIFDGDCRFCRAWIARWQQATGEAVEYKPFQDPQVAARFPELPRARFEQAVHLIEPDGRVTNGAAAVFRALALGTGPRWPRWAYEAAPSFAAVTEWSYRLIARHRAAAWFVTRLAWGSDVLRPSYLLSRWLFLRMLGAIYLVAFVSMWTQIDGLIGSRGILPVERWLQWEGGPSLAACYESPTLVWLNASDGFLHFLCAAGFVCSLFVILGIAPAAALAALWALYLSLVVAGQEFLSFQWDVLLVETGFLAIFLAPWQLWPRLDRESAPSRLALWLLGWLLFRLMFQSGCGKLLSGDRAWWDLTALQYHYETQPLPTWIGWYAHQLPGWMQKVSAGGMFFIELVVPFLIFFPRHARQVAFGLLAALQLLIALTGNYCFFNWLTVALLVLLLDDAVLARLLRRPAAALSSAAAPPRSESLVKRVPTAIVAVVVLTVTSGQLTAMFRDLWRVPRPLMMVWRLVAPFNTINSYGLFAVMTKSRPEIVIEGSHDGATWRTFEFKYKPGDLSRRPAFVAPHQPRLDWQMWFAALSDYHRNPWLLNFMVRLLEGSPEVLALLDNNPFPEQPPCYVRAVVFDYHFTDAATRQATGQWWQRERPRPYCPVIYRDDARPGRAGR